MSDLMRIRPIGPDGQPGATVDVPRDAALTAVESGRAEAVTTRLQWLAPVYHRQVGDVDDVPILQGESHVKAGIARPWHEGIGAPPSWPPDPQPEAAAVPATEDLSHAAPLAEEGA
jgi:hypothetical protein